MNRWIAFLRGVNVGGKNKLPMAELRAVLEKASFANVKTYIQSGNIILQADETVSRDDIISRLKSLLKDSFQIDAPVMVLSEDELRTKMRANPLGQSFDAPNWMFLFFLSKTPDAPKLDDIKALASDNEKFGLLGDVFYFYAGDGAGRSKLMAKAEKLLGVSATARNWKTVQKCLAMVETP